MVSKKPDKRLDNGTKKPDKPERLGWDVNRTARQKTERQS
jgi:hypothetical protein